MLAVAGVELDDVGGAEARAEPQGDETPGRGAGDQVEVVGDCDAELGLDLGEDHRRVQAFQTATVEGQDLERARRSLLPSPPAAARSTT